MEILKHRANSLEALDSRFGAEIDVRDFNGKIVLSHDLPNETCVELSTYLECYSNNSLLAINIKSFEIEKKLKEVLDSKNVKNYFIFDLPIPYLIKALNMKLNCAFRLSEYEKEIFKRCQWVWVDNFHNLWFDEEYLEMLKNNKLKIAIVSPDIHNRQNREEFEKIKNLINSGLVDAICTDFPDKW